MVGELPTNITPVTMSRRMRWMGHVTRMAVRRGEERCAHNFVGET
jgi:hypothetical protein